MRALTWLEVLVNFVQMHLSLHTLIEGCSEALAAAKRSNKDKEKQKLMQNRDSSSFDPTSFNITWLEHFLRRTRRRFLLLNGLKGILEVTIGLVLWGALLAVLHQQSGIGNRLYLVWWAGVAVGVVYLIWSWRRAAIELSRTPIAEQVESWNPQASGFLTALELGRALPGLAQTPLYSERLSEARIDQVASTMRALHPVEIVPFEAFRSRAYTFLGAAMLVFGVMAFFPNQSAKTLGAMFAPAQQVKINPLMQTERNALVVGDLKVTYRYPDYLNKPPRTIHNSDGSLSALKGTKAELEARALFAIKKAAIHLNNKTFIPLKVGKDKRQMLGSLDLLQAGFYRFILTAEDDSIHRGPTHPIQIEKDAVPKVKMLWPQRDMELQSQKGLRIAYRFSDDHGISKVYLVYKNTSSKHMRKPRRKLLREFKNPPRGGTGQTEWELQSLPFSPGDRIAYYIEVEDTDTISGPKKGRSETRHVRLFSPFKQHDKLIALQEKLLDKMTGFLGDLIESPKVDKAEVKAIERIVQKLNSKGGLLMKEFAGLLPLMRKDPLTQPYTLIAMENLENRFKQRQLTRVDLEKRLTTLRQYLPLLKQDVQSNRRVEIPGQEDDVYAFSLLLNRQQLDLMAQLARKLNEAQNRLSELLEKFKQNKTEENKRALLRQMDRVESLIRQIRQRMAKLQRRIPDEFLNMSAFKKKNSTDHIKAMRKMIKEGKLEDVAKRLSKLAQSIESMVSQMDKYAKEAGGQLVSRMAAAMQKMINDLQQLEKKQERLAQRTQQMQRDLMKRMQKALKKKLDALVKKQLKRTKEIKRDLKSINQKMGRSMYRYRYHMRMKTLEQRIKELESLLKSRDVFESLQTVQRFQSRAYRMEQSFRFLQQVSRNWPDRNFPGASASLRHMKKALRNADRIRDDLERFFPNSKPHMNKRDHRLMRRYQKDQSDLRRQAQQLQQKLQQMSKKMPVFRPKMQQKLQQASSQMKQAAKRLGNRSPRPAYSHQQKAISALRKLRQSMRQSMQPQGKNGGSGKQRQGNRGGKGGLRGFRRQQSDPKVKIPKPGQHKAPKALRQDILDAMKEKLPHRYREPVRKYYEKLVK